MSRRIAKVFMAGAAGMLVYGCAAFDASPPAVNALQEPVAQQIMNKVPSLRTQRFSTVLDFETDADRVFVTMKPAGTLVWDRSHTGKRSLYIPPGTQRVTVKLSSVLSGRQFPGDWTLVGAFLYCDEPIEVNIGIEGTDVSVLPRRVPLTRESWSIAMADVSGHSETNSSAGDAKLVITLPANAPAVWCDDVLLIDNKATIIASAAPAPIRASQNPEYHVSATVGPATSPSDDAQQIEERPNAGWTVQLRGLSYIGEVPGKFNFSLLTSEVSRAGWRIEEANALRARFASDGRTKNLTVYNDGRAFTDGQWTPMSAEVRDNPAFADAHGSPAQITIAEELGRVNRDTPGDANNDGYNEERGAHQIIASGARLELKITPHTPKLVRPILEVSGLSDGEVLITVEGQLIEDRAVRLDNGTLLVELPVKMDRPTTVNLRVQ